MNERSYLLLFILCGLILAALTIRDGRLLLLALPFLAYIIFGILQIPGEISLVASRTFSSTGVQAKKPIEMRVVLENRGGDLANLCLDDRCFPSMVIQEGRARRFLSLAAGDTAELKYVFQADRGLYSWSVIHTRSSDTFGLFDLDFDIPAGGEILVSPAPMRLRPLAVEPRFTIHSSGPVSARLAGSGTDFFSVREYRAGDSLRHLNRRLTSRHPRKWFTNEFEREEVSDFGFILDARRQDNGERGGGALFEYSVSAASSLINGFLKDGNRVSLLIIGETLTPVFPGYGRKHQQVLIRHLACAQQGEKVSFGILDYVPVRLFPARSLLVIFSSVDPHDLETYARLRAFGYEVVLISPDPVDFAFRTMPQTNVHRMAFRAARVERVIQLKHLMKLGVSVVDWQVAAPLESALQEGLHGRRYRRGE